MRNQKCFYDVYIIAETWDTKSAVSNLYQCSKPDFWSC